MELVTDVGAHILFEPDIVGLPGPGDSATVTVQVIGVPAGVDAVQVNLQHPANLSISNLQCVELFAGAIAAGRFRCPKVLCWVVRC